MPFVSNTGLNVRHANTTMAKAFWPRIRKSIFPTLAGSYRTTSLVEPFALMGAPPPMQQFSGSMDSNDIPSWNIEVPNLLYKNIVDIRREDLEGDQTRTLVKYATAVASTVAKLPDRILLKRIMSGHLSTSATVNFKGRNYTLTLDGQPFFSRAHTTYGRTVQSNIVDSGLPTTAAAVAAQDVATTVGQLQGALQGILSLLKTAKDNQGEPIYSEIDTGQSLVVCVPAALEYAAYLAFRATGSVIGGSGGTSGSNGGTSNTAPMYVKNLIVSGRLDGMIDPETPTPTFISPSYATAFYVFVTDDEYGLKPFYQSLWAPPGEGDLFPKGYSIADEADRLMRDAKKNGVDVSYDAAVLFAGSIVEHNLGAVGDRAQRDVVTGEKHFISGRSRTNFAYGPWYTGYKVVPVGGGN